jgi:hypothetical protein
METNKFQHWCKAFLDPKSETMGNATQSALKSYKTKNYHSAGQIGYENLKKLETLGLMIAESEGLTVKEWYKIAAAKAVKGSYEQTINFMQRIGIMAKDGPANQINQQFNFADLAETFTAARIARGLPVD